MPIKQTWNSKVKRWVKYDIVPGKAKGSKFAKWLDQKQKNPTVPFKGIPISKTSKRQR